MGGQRGNDQFLSVSAPCQHFGACGGCVLQNVPYEEQLKRKEAVVRNLFGECLPIIPSPETFFYRNRLDFAFGPNYTLGLKAGKFDVINIEKCWLMSEGSNAILDRLRYFVSWKKLKGYRYALPNKERGPMRHVVIREGKNIKNTILNILTADKVEFPLEALWEKIQNLVQGVTWSINLSPADRSYGEIQKTFGQDYYLESLNGLKFKIPVQSFFQTNTHQAENLLKIVADFADLQGGETLLDLYSGTGSIGLSLANKAKAVVGVEENAAAAELSKANAELNGIKNYAAKVGRVENVVKALEEKFDLVVLDPPRPGVHKKALQKIGEIRPQKIVYVSCNPLTQKTDVELLRSFGYKVEKCQPLDMFPHTPHIENILLLRR
ncbi:23S rRNA (uracil-5-)-methyltransferase RumA [candidate division WOR-1 bacterium RIFCSPHIGHO2_02_FULL_45_12]|uniref:23S rRNA (Uracil-5-)-methyltransferase RumA n=1 Tax=candidate division WOR-1 bacterium RIFCSPLOWO2_12_FULL_45_9 TaxID=1802568 RepID=A0A1F4RLU8_UNCSA|nr:MAG: 23S rRNA (uracil-5-)-methyltransferase RumA [candidate division WOR-1 bacterium RIFCSPHIGHO2_02_FULL_45_12]OGC09194.1 MAG: 23S rRNA (uracil-5-)-methyltransferase RumA [candidate division WOR-1 bacterium RIFCSPLOWO2_12_FULL_45_9]